MNLKEKIQQDLVSALKAGEKTVVSTLRMLQSSIRNKEIHVMREIDYQEVLSVIEREIKQRREAAEGFEKGGRADSAQKEKDEASILEKYLPERLAEEEVSKIISETIAEVGATQMSDMGKVMGALTTKLKGQADMSQVSSLVREQLGG